ncbi:fibronectin type III domain-containing protein [Spirillospora sp. NPDC047418]
MKPKKLSRRVRTGTVLGSATGLMLAMAAAVAAAPAASAAEPLLLNYKCTYPLVGPQDLKVKISATIPEKVALNTPTPTINIEAVSTVSADTTFGLWTTRTKSLTGTAVASAVLTAPQYSFGLPLKPKMTLAPADVPESGAFDITATGSQVPLTFNKAGWAQITVGNLDLAITPLGADGQPTGLGQINASCKQLPGQNNVLAQFLIDDGSNPPKPEPKNGTFPGPAPTKVLGDAPGSPEKTLQYTCPFPLVGDGDLTVKIKSNVPAEIPVSTGELVTFTKPIEVTSVSTVPADVNENGLQQLGAVEMDGSVLAEPTITVPEMAGPVPLWMKLQLAKTDVPPTGPVDINGPGSAPALSFTKTGTGKVTLDNINIQNFTTYQADGTPANLGDFTCTLKPGQENTLFSFDIVDGGTNPEPDTTAPSVPANVSGTGTDDSASVKWDAATDNEGGSGVKGYYVTVDGQKRPDVVAGTETTVSGLAKGDHTFAVSAVDNAGNESEASAPVTVNVPGVVVPDTTAPSVPANVTGTGDGESASLSWDASTDNEGGDGVKGYYVTVDGQKRPDVVTGTSTTIAGLAKGDHTFAVSAVDNAGNESAASAPITVNVPGSEPEPDTTAPSVPANVSGTGTDDSASVKWDAATDNEGGSGVKGYYVTVDGQKRPDVVTGTETTVSGLAKGDHTFAVSAVDNAGNESDASAAITVAVPGDDTPPGDTVSYALAGTSTIKGGNGKVALSGAVSAKVDGSGKVAADLTLNPTTGSFSLFGFLPATADIAFAPQGQTTGTLSGGTLTTQTKTLVKVPSVKVFGLNIGGGETCQASAPATIPLKSTNFSVAGGGTLTGEYTLPSLTGCGFLTPVISQIVAGGGNKIDLKATPKK